MRRAAASFVVAILLLAPASALARSWHALTPGVSTKTDVIRKFGSATRELPMSPTYASALIYQAKAAREYGAEEAQFFFDAAGKLTSIYVFPQVQLKKDDVIKAYGSSYDERRTDDFRLYFQYRTEGFIVFFDKDNETVYQLQYVPAAAAAPAPQPTPPPAEKQNQTQAPPPAGATGAPAPKTAASELPPPH